MMSVFLEDLRNIDDHEFQAVKSSVLSDITTFSNSLKDVADKYYDDMDEEMLEPNEHSYHELCKGITQKSLQRFAKERLVKQSRRLTIELFAKKITEEERCFRLMPSFNLNQQSYQLTSIEEMMKRKWAV